MITGFHVYSREHSERELVWWESISAIVNYKWIFCNETCPFPKSMSSNSALETGHCIIFTYDKL